MLHSSRTALPVASILGFILDPFLSYLSYPNSAYILSQTSDELPTLSPPHLLCWKPRVTVETTVILSHPLSALQPRLCA